MAPVAADLRTKAATIIRHPRTRKVAIWLVASVVTISVLVGLVAPPLLRGKIAGELSKKLHRPVTIEQIKINPYTLTVTVRGFLMREKQGPVPALSFDELFVNLELRSLMRLAPVIEELRLVKPYVNLVRYQDSKYNVQDLIDEFTSGPSGPTPRFALNNIQVIDGKIDFDDQPEQTKHSITALKIGVPFISSLPSDVEIKVKPEFAAVINGAPFYLAGDSTTPFKDSLESTLSIKLDKLEIAKYLEYSPVTLNFKVPSGQLSGKVTATFKSAAKTGSTLALSGNLNVDALEMLQPSAAPLLKLPHFDVVVDPFEVFANKISLKSIKSKGLELHIGRDRKGEINLFNLVAPAANAQPATAKKDDGKPFDYQIEEIVFDGVTIYFADEQPQLPYKTRLDNVTFKVTGLSSEAGKKANIDLSFETDGKEKVSHSGTVQLKPLLVEGKLDIEALRAAALSPYYRDALAAEVKDGFLDLSTQYSFEDKPDQPDFKLSGLNANLRNFRLELAGQPEPLWRAATLAIKDATVDVAKKTVLIALLEGKNGNGYIQRDKDGNVNFSKIAKPAPAPASPPPAPKAGDEWKIEAKQIALDRFRINVDDRGLATPAKLNLSELSIRGSDFSTAKNRPAKLTIRTKINNTGALVLTGTAMANPPSAKLAVDGQNIELLPFQPYLENQVNFLLTGGQIGTKGNLVFDGSGVGPAKVGYDGSVDVADFATIEKSNSNDLVKWKSLNLNALQFNLDPFKLSIGEINLGDFYSRLILGADGKMNLQKLTPESEETKTEPVAEKTAAKAPEAKTPDKPEPSAPAAPNSDKPITIGKINLTSGNVNFTDLFIKPNYNANLTGVQGTISELKPEAPGDIDIQARLDNAAPVVIKGKLNPLSKELFLDIVADAKEIELSPMTPYSGRYVGYGIEKGKLSFNVKYKLENRKLSAENKIILNQLTFGEKIDSPDATKLPVLFAVNLLKDRNGVIDIDLPISGSLDDPQFSVGGIVWRIIVNILTKAVTAPFSLLGAVFSGGGSSGEELSYIEFDNGRASLNEVGKSKIATLAKALNNRPSINLELIGRVDPASDLEGLKRVGIERKAKAQKLRELVRQGQAQRSVDDVQFEKDEYQKYLKAAYGEESFPKPRNLIGLAVDLPVAEMEKLMLQHAKATDEDMRQLASQRAQAVRDALMATGQVGADRLFIVAAKPLGSEEQAKLKGKPNRVDFNMK
ncbi:MAG TPA: DUF748 domain-containing protein [Candidatus Binatia bacterium]|nr:DUF748 domain-containing protein [Candidatus Binatia bacterium]